MSEKREAVQRIVQQNLYAAVATITPDGQPWNSPCFVSFDNNGDFYWMSSPDSQHSRNVADGGSAFLVVYDSTARWGTGLALYMQASVSVLTLFDDIEQALQLLCDRVQQARHDPHEFSEDAMRRVYRARIERLWINDGLFDDRGELVGDVRLELPLDHLCDLVNW